MIKIGIVGTRGLSYIPGFRSIEGVEVTALCGVQAAKTEANAKKHSVPYWYTSLSELLKSDVDAVFVSTPMHMHAQQCMEVLEAGKDVLSEVTAGVSMHELFCLKTAVEESGRKYMMAENFCYRPDAVLVRKMVKEGRFGDIYYAETDHIEDMKFFCCDKDGKRQWRSWWQLGKHGAYYPTHAIGPVMKWLDGDSIDELSCFGVRPYLYDDIPQEATTTTIIRTKKGRMIKLRVDAISNRPTQISYYGLQGTTGTLESYRGDPAKQDGAYVYFNDGSIRFKEEHHWQDLSQYYGELSEEYQEKIRLGESFFNIGDYFCARDFARMLKGEIEPPVSIYEACEWTAVALLSELSVQNNGKTIKMPNFRGSGAEYEIKL